MTKWQFYSMVLSLLVLVGCKKKPTDQTPEPDAYAVQLKYNVKWISDPLEFNSLIYKNAGGNDLSISNFKFLVSDIELTQNDGSKYKVDEVYGFINKKDGQILIDLGEIPKGTYKELAFKVGLNEAENKGDPSQWGPSHPLNPIVNKMYWDWSSGYVFIVLEGTYLVGGSTVTGYSYHIAFEENLMQINIAKSFTVDAEKTINIDVDVSEVFKNPTIFDIEERGSVSHSSSDSGIAADLSTNILDAFSIQ